MVLRVPRSAIIHSYLTENNGQHCQSQRNSRRSSLSRVFISTRPVRFLFAGKVGLYLTGKAKITSALLYSDRPPYCASFYVICVKIALKWNGLFLSKLHIKQRGLFQSNIPYVDDKPCVWLLAFFKGICN